MLLATVLSTSKFLEAVISPPPLRPSPAVNVTPLWSICSFATKFAKASWSIATSVALVICPSAFTVI